MQRRNRRKKSFDNEPSKDVPAHRRSRVSVYRGIILRVASGWMSPTKEHHHELSRAVALINRELLRLNVLRKGYPVAAAIGSPADTSDDRIGLYLFIETGESSTSGLLNLAEVRRVDKTARPSVSCCGGKSPQYLLEVLRKVPHGPMRYAEIVSIVRNRKKKGA